MNQVSLSSNPLGKDEIESRIANVWSTVLGSEVEDHSKNFFDAGGSSLKMMRVHAELARSLERKIPITTMFEFPSIAALAEHLAATPHDASTSPPQAQVAQSETAPAAPALRRKFRVYKK